MSSARARALALAARGRRGLHRLSLRARLVAVVTGLLVVALALTATITLVVLNRVLVGQVDDDLRGVTSSPSAVQQTLDRASVQSGVPSDYVVQVTAADGDTIRTLSGNGARWSVHFDDITLARTQEWRQDPHTVEGSGGDWRVVAVPVTFDDDPASLVVARPLAGIHETIAKVAVGLGLIGVAVVLACAVLGAAAIRRAFRPLRDVEAVTAAFGGGDTSRRVVVPAPGTEVGRLGSAVNAMLDSVETSLAAREASESRMRRFVSDASHELRTPLAAIRGFAELHRMGAVRRPEDVAGAFTRIEAEASRMGGLVEDLLALARLDEQRPMRRDPVDLLALVADARADARALAPDRETTVVGVDGAPPRPVVVTGDEARLRQVLANLVANALRHTPAGTPVELGVGSRGGWAVWRVVDHGPGIAPEDAERVFERFWRADSSRARTTGGGSGLGMAIVAGIVKAHGGAVRVVGTPGGGATIEVALPLAAPPVGPDDPADADDGAEDGADGGADDLTDVADDAPDDVAGGADHLAGSEHR